MRLPSPLRRSVERALRQAKSLAETQDSAMAEEDYNVKTENELAAVPPRAVKVPWRNRSLRRMLIRTWHLSYTETTFLSV